MRTRPWGGVWGRSAAGAFAALVLAAGCAGPRVYVNFPGSGEPATPPPAAAAPAAAPEAAPVAAPASARETPAPPEPVPAYWALYANWWTDHQGILRRLASSTFSLPSLEPLFRGAADSLRAVKARLSPEAGLEMEAFAASYADLGREALRDGNRGILEQRTRRLGKQIAATFSKEPEPVRSPGR